MISHCRWHDAVHAVIAHGGRAVLVSVAGGAGSTPREPGAAMVVSDHGAWGTIGGGHLEFEATRLAREALADTAPPAQWLVRFPLAARLGQCCGGVATLSFATLDAGASPWLEGVAACARANTPCVVVGRIEPGEFAGGRLVVTADDARGSLGTPALDSVAVAQARERLASSPAESRGGSGVLTVDGVTLFLHVNRPNGFAVAVFGNGHVGRALVQVLGALPADVRWIDIREHDFPERVPGNVEIVATDDPVAEIAGTPRGSCLVVMTHSHPLDFDIVEAALSRGDFAYVGMIGSKSKRAQFERRLAARGVSADTLRRLTCPIGGGVLRSKEPGVIAVAVAAELLALREAIEVRPPKGVEPGIQGMARTGPRRIGSRGD